MCFVFNDRRLSTEWMCCWACWNRKAAAESPSVPSGADDDDDDPRWWALFGADCGTTAAYRRFSKGELFDVLIRVKLNVCKCESNTEWYLKHKSSCTTHWVSYQWFYLYFVLVVISSNKMYRHKNSIWICICVWLLTEDYTNWLNLHEWKIKIKNTNKSIE